MSQVHSAHSWYHLTSARIVLGFVFWSAAWIIFSDALLHLKIPVFPEVIWPLETVKGLLYLAVTAPQLYAFIRVREREEKEARMISESRLQSLSESNLIAIQYWSSNGDITDANDAFLKLLGYTRNELLEGELNWRDFTPKEHRIRDIEAVQKLRRDGGQVVYEKEYIRKDGTRVPVLIGGALLYGSKNRGIAYTIDISERKKAQRRSADLESQLRQSQKLEAVGQLASGVAHDFNNLLSVIIGYASLMEVKLSPEDQLHAHTQRILNASAKATDLIKNLLAFGRKQVLKPEILDVNAVVRNFSSMLLPLIGELIELRLELAPNLWSVEADRQQLEQVIMNLAVNARDAMPGGGTLTISTANDEDTATVVLSCRDTGAGMDEPTKARIFEPFFTTKPHGKGTGLGLATVYGIVVQSGGNIKVSSEPGRGSTFDVFLPRAGGERVAVIPGGNDQRRIASMGSETILLVEDERDLRRLLKHVLESRGYTVLEASNGEDAVNLVKGHRGDIQLLLTDIIMPRMSGWDAAHQIRSFRPAIKVIYMTGYAEDKILRPGSLAKDEALLEKPVVPDELAERIRQMLEGPGQQRTVA